MENQGKEENKRRDQGEERKEEKSEAQGKVMVGETEKNETEVKKNKDKGRNRERTGRRIERGTGEGKWVRMKEGTQRKNR